MVTPYADNSCNTFDVFCYPSGKEYIVTDHGPNVWSVCALCGAQAACTPDLPMAKVRCGQCLLEQYQMRPGQAIYEAKARYAAESRLSRLPSRRAASASSYGPRPPSRRG